jgi:hypothetical protein
VRKKSEERTGDVAVPNIKTVDGIVSELRQTGKQTHLKL